MLLAGKGRGHPCSGEAPCLRGLQRLFLSSVQSNSPGRTHEGMRRLSYGLPRMESASVWEGLTVSDEKPRGVALSDGIGCRAGCFG